MSTKTKVLVIFAPTASGKTALTRELFSPQGSHFILKAEIISADSQAVYKEMDIGTAKPEADLQKEIPHHLINLLTPDLQYNVSDFVNAADKACQEITARGNLPVVVGGTGFYIRNFLYGLAPTPVSDEKLRNELKERIAREGNQALYDELKKIDPESAAKIHPNDAYRICRALEVFYLSGKKRSEYQAEGQGKIRDKFDFKFLVLQPEREELYDRIRRRVDLMFEVGLEDEVRSLVAKGYGKDSPGMKAIGYSEWFAEDGSLYGPEKIEEIKEAIKHHSTKYAKKQYTYIRDIPGSQVIEFTAQENDILNITEIINQWIATSLRSSQ
ncbi:tRNA (adenosine(37)-N6)-dimethylallyltransferase MiaA [Treponema bryantii]|uniref:tRNA (adenosine(37)-N6)-dimethylallyltransferase MiaA n=1 Tax=Treponema bryantii TaxID=163 RepID=UPI0003B6D805|nr:tRNA (adenosine(37)-N6)-dimethylallyltransferase MiaA [Treponema bryantii]